MNSYYLLGKLEKLRNLIDIKSPIIKIIRGIAYHIDTVTQLIGALERIALQADINSRRRSTQEASQVKVAEEIQLLQDKANLIRQRITAVPPKKFFVGISALEEAINELVQELGEDNNNFAGLLAHLESFNTSYESFFRSDSYEDIIDIVYSARNLIESFETIVGFIDSLKKNLLVQVEYGESLQEITIFLTSSYLCKEFIGKLDAIQEVYTELCLLVNVSEAEFPLTIVKIESNSLFARIFGEAKVISILGELIKDTISFFYRKYTNEGKIQAISRQAEAIESVLELNKKLEQAGIDTSESKEVIRKSAVIIADKLNHLLLGEPEIELNGEFISLDSKFKQKYMEGSRVFLLKSSDPELEDKS